MLKKIILYAYFYEVGLRKFVTSATAFAQDGTGFGGQPPGGGTGWGGQTPGGVTLENPLGTTNVAELLDRIVNYLIVIASPIVAIMVIIGAFQMLFAAGDPEKFKKGQKTIIFAVVGFAIILISKGITSIIEQLLR